jgi:hypothetical protein
MSRPALPNDDLATLAGIVCALLALAASAFNATFLTGVGIGGAVAALAMAQVIGRRQRALAAARKQRLLHVVRGN